MCLNDGIGRLLRDTALRRAAALVVAMCGEENVAGMSLELDVVVGELAELGVIGADVLLLGLDAQAQAGNQVHQEEDDACQDERVRETGDGVGDLVPELYVVVVDPATGDHAEAVERRYVITIGALVKGYQIDTRWGYKRGEKTGEQVSDDTTDSVDGENIESIIGAHEELEFGSDVAADSTDNTENESRPRRDKAGGRGDGDEACNGAGAETDDGPFLL